MIDSSLVLLILHRVLAHMIVHTNIIYLFALFCRLLFARPVVKFLNQTVMCPFRSFRNHDRQRCGRSHDGIFPRFDFTGSYLGAPLVVKEFYCIFGKRIL